jgi:hypothetical protein
LVVVKVCRQGWRQHRRLLSNTSRSHGVAAADKGLKLVLSRRRACKWLKVCVAGACQALLTSSCPVNPAGSGAGQRHAGISPRCRLPRRQQSHTVTQALSYWQPLLLTTLPVCKCLCAPVQPDTVTQQQASGIGGLTSLVLLTLVVERQAVDNYVSHQPAIPVFTCLLQVQVTYHNRPHTGASSGCYCYC